MAPKDEAERLRQGILGGWLKVEEAVSWADRQIEQVSQPHPTLVELAVARHSKRDSVAALLEAVPGTVNRIAVMRHCLDDLLDVVERDPRLARDAARWLETAANRDELPASEFGHEPSALADAFALAESGTAGTIDDARERLILFLRENGTREA